MANNKKSQPSNSVTESAQPQDSDAQVQIHSIQPTGTGKPQSSTQPTGSGGENTTSQIGGNPGKK